MIRSLFSSSLKWSRVFPDSTRKWPLLDDAIGCTRTYRNAVSTLGGAFSTSAPNSSSGLLSKMSVIGAGKMAQAIIESMVTSGVQPANQISVYDVSHDTMSLVQERYGVQISQSIPDCMEESGLVLFCVKPQNLTQAFFEQVRRGKPSLDAIVLSVIAGVPLSTLAQGGIERVVRSMPNTPATIGQGMTVWSCTQNLTKDDRLLVGKVLESFGKEMFVDEETFIDISTSISGSGPAYIFMLMEAMIDAGVHMGFPRNQATTLVYHTMLGSTLYAIETGEHPAILRNRVTSPSGTTASALYELENGKFRTVIKDAMWACYRRSLEIGNLDSNVGPDRRRAPTHDEGV